MPIMNISDAKILLVDDSALARRMTKKILDGFGAQHYMEAADGYEAIKAYKEYKPDLVLLDIVMPELDGLKAGDEINSYDPDANIIYISSAGTQSNLEHVLGSGSRGFIQKPFNADDLKLLLKYQFDDIN